MFVCGLTYNMTDILRTLEEHMTLAINMMFRDTFQKNKTAFMLNISSIDEDMSDESKYSYMFE